MGEIVRVPKGPGRRVNRSLILMRWNNQDRLVATVAILSLAYGAYAIYRDRETVMGGSVAAFSVAAVLIGTLTIYREYSVRWSRKIFVSCLYLLVIGVSVWLFLLFEGMPEDVLELAGINPLAMLSPAVEATVFWLIYLFTLHFKPPTGLGRRRQTGD